jgi:sphingomyelin phosphodiesterase acid-like 3
MNNLSFSQKCFFSTCFMLVLLLFQQSGFAGNFLSLSDIHFDPFITCDKGLPTCPLIDKLQQAPANTWQAILIAADTKPAQYKQDSNYPLLVSTLQALHAVAEAKKPQFVLILGDYLGHNYKDKYLQFSTDKSEAGYQAFVKKTMEFLTAEINTAFPATDVYMTPGNNDSYIDDNVYEPNGAYFQDMSVILSGAIKQPELRNEMRNSFSHNGYYAVTIPNQPELRVIMLNSNLFSAFARGNNIEAAADAELEWLHKQLEQATQHQQKILLAMHIPIGVDVFASLRNQPFAIVEHWRPRYVNYFKNMLLQYSTRIMGVLAAHEHSDWLRVFTNPLNQQKIPIVGIPSISPANQNNPAFKLFDYDANALELENYTKYFYLLGSTRTWQPEYEFNTVYQPDCRACRLVNGMDLLKNTGDLVEQYKKYYDAETGSDLIHTHYAPYYVCQLHAITAAEYQACMTVRKKCRVG